MGVERYGRGKIWERYWDRKVWKWKTFGSGKGMVVERYRRGKV